MRPGKNNKMEEKRKNLQHMLASRISKTNQRKEIKMKVYDEPKVYLLSRPQLNHDGLASFFKDMEAREENYFLNQQDKQIPTDGETLAEIAGRICYCSFGASQGRKTNKEYLGNILEQGHGSVLEHANYTFLISQCSRGMTHELVRHRAGFAYSQESTHFRAYTLDNSAFIVPDEGQLREEQNILEELARKSIQTYEYIYSMLIKQGTPKKIACATARQILPTGLESKIVVTGNMRAWRHFIEARGNKHNVKEIRLVAIKITEVLLQECRLYILPSAFSFKPR